MEVCFLYSVEPAQPLPILDAFFILSSRDNSTAFITAILFLCFCFEHGHAPANAISFRTEINLCSTSHTCTIINDGTRKTNGWQGGS